MKSKAALKLIKKMQEDLKKGIVTDTLIADLKELRPYAIEEEDPSLTKVIRLTYEHLEGNGTFNIPIPEDGFEEEDLEEGMEVNSTADEDRPDIEQDFEAKRESLGYLLSIMENCDTNAGNREDLIAYRNALMEY